MSRLTLPHPPARPALARDPFSLAVLGVDFSSASLAAARWATTHVAHGADVVLAHVAPPSGAPTRYVPSSADRGSAGVTGGLEGFADTLGVANAESVTRVGAPSHWLSVIANDAEASLLVLGRRADTNRTGVGEPNVVERAARRTNASVLVVPEGTTQPLVHVLAAVDESDVAPRVLALARSLADAHDLPLTIVHVLAPEMASYARVRRPPRGQMHSRVFAVETARLPPGGLPSHSARWLLDMARSCELRARDRVIVRMGDPVREIAATASAATSTLVVVGTRGADGAPPGALGSVARELLTRAPVPVLAVHPPRGPATLLGA